MAQMNTPWREVATPHSDVLKGAFQEAEFAVDLSKVKDGDAIPEYQDAKQFFSRTYLTEGMRLLLESVLRRLSGKGGDPVVQLQTAFGGGKTHSLLAVLHICADGNKASELEGLEELLNRVKLDKLIPAKTVVIDGNRFSPAQPHIRPGCKINTLWGELAHQLGGETAYRKIEAADKQGVSPGKELIKELLEEYSPCVILVDELVAYVRQLDPAKSMVGGSFDTMTSFLQALTESVTATPRAMVLASLPESNTEAGGDLGRKALRMCEKFFGRVQAIWKPVTAEEAYGVVRRRLFQNISSNQTVEICKAWHDWYLQNKDLFPSKVREETYRHEMERCYPLHPELLRTLYEKWSVLEKFQRTRGVLQLMALSIHRLWEENNKEALIMPGSIPLNDPAVINKLLSYLPQRGWEAVIDSDIEGPRSNAGQIEQADVRFGSCQAARRSARAIFLSTSPGLGSQGGISMEQQLLSTVQAGEEIPAFKDVRQKLIDRLHYLSKTGDSGLVFDIRPNLQREVEDRKRRFKASPERATILSDALKNHLHDVSQPVHIFTPSQDIPDDDALRIVVLPERVTWNDEQKATIRAHCMDYIVKRGEWPRKRQNRILLLIADFNDLPLLQDKCASLMAWDSIIKDSRILDLTESQKEDAQARYRQCQAEVTGFIPSVWCHLVALAEDHSSPREPELRNTRVETASNESLATSLRRHMEHHELSVPVWAPSLLLDKLSQLYWKDSSSVAIQKLWEDICSYLYFPRLKDRSVLLDCIDKGVVQKDWFGYCELAEGNDFKGFVFGKHPNATTTGYLVEKSAAEKYALKISVPAGHVGASEGGGTGPGDPHTQPQPVIKVPTAPATQKRCMVEVHLGDAIQAQRKFRDVMEDVVKHLADSDDVRITLEVQSQKKSGYDDSVKRIVRENTNALGGNGEFYSE